MPFIYDGDSACWVVDEMAPWRRTVVAYLRTCYINPRMFLYNQEIVELHEQQDLLFDAIFAPLVRKNWQWAVAEINGLVKLWTAMHGSNTEYEHWFVDPGNYRAFRTGVRDQLRSIYYVCGESEQSADDAYRDLVIALLCRAISREEEMIWSCIQSCDDEARVDADTRQRILRRLLAPFFEGSQAA